MIIFKNELNAIITMLSWLAPTENTDGTPIDYSLTYQLYINGAATMVFPGTLNPDGKYTFLLQDVPALQEEGSYTIELTAFREGVDLSEFPELESDKSGSIIVTTVLVIRPKGPSDFSTE
jgi:hypothetical protein